MTAADTLVSPEQPPTCSRCARRMLTIGLMIQLRNDRYQPVTLYQCPVCLTLQAGRLPPESVRLERVH